MTSERRMAYEARRDAEPCLACTTSAAVIDVEGVCADCDWRGSVSYLHSCKTGWRWPMCAYCNEQQPETNQPRHL